MTRLITIGVCLVALAPVSGWAQGKTVPALLRLEQTTQKAVSATSTQLEKAVTQAVQQAERTAVSATEALAGTVTQVPGVGTIRSFPVLDINKGVDYGLHVPTRRGHEHYVPMDMKGIVERLWRYNKHLDLAARWQEIGGKMHYTNQKALAQDLHKLYQGQGIPVKDVTRTEGFIYTLPVEGIVYEPSGRPARVLTMQDDAVVYYSRRDSGQLIVSRAEALRFYKLNATPEEVEKALEF